MPRESMLQLIGDMRRMINDPAGAEQVFEDDEIEQALDARRMDIRYEDLSPLPAVYNGTVEYRTWFGGKHWETGVVLTNTQYAVLTPSASDNRNGRWSFDSHQPAVMASGQMYDLHGVAADLLERQAVQAAMEYDVSADGENYKRSQKREALMAMAAQYRRSQWLQVARQVRNDLNIR